MLQSQTQAAEVASCGALGGTGAKLLTHSLESCSEGFLLSTHPGTQQGLHVL